MTRWLRSLALIPCLATAIAGCGDARRTFEEGVEHLPGPSSFVVRIEPTAAADRLAITFSAYDGDVVETHLAQRDERRYVIGTTLPSTLRAQVDGVDCDGEIDLPENTEADATLTIEATGCDLRLDLLHVYGTIEHGLEDVP